MATIRTGWGVYFEEHADHTFTAACRRCGWRVRAVGADAALLLCREHRCPEKPEDDET